MFLTHQNALFYKFQYLSVSSTLKYYGIECIEGRISMIVSFICQKPDSGAKSA